MITYDRTAFGLNLIARVHGSAVYRAIIPGLMSVFCLILFRQFMSPKDNEDNDLQHPYSIGVLLSSTTFLVVFRANQGYARYWEGASAIHHMMSKWMDATVHVAVYHMQCDHYDKIKPPSFFDHADLNNRFMTRERERGRSSRKRQNKRRSTIWDPTGKPRGDDVDMSSNIIFERSIAKSISPVDLLNFGTDEERQSRSKGSFMNEDESLRGPTKLDGPPRLDGGYTGLFSDGKATFYSERRDDPGNPNVRGTNPVPTFASFDGGRTPPLFLQELAHLCSLMNAVALSTLRNDIEGAASPLGIYKPGSPWPEVDPDKIDSYYLNGPIYARILRRILYFVGVARSPQERTRYNAARPLPVYGGVSDAEIQMLQMAQGPSAKTQLCWYWLSEFVIREHLAGTLGKVGPPIVSRTIQFLGDGMIHYNHARKIMFIPFPFPHAQLSALFVMLTVPGVAFLMDQFTDDIMIAGTLTFFAVACLSGIHEVARELENPFRNVPNELPLVTLQAYFNEALMVMFSGYHPDLYWQRPMDEPSTDTEATLPEDLNDLVDDSTDGTTTETTHDGNEEAAAELKKMEKKMTEYGEEIDRLRRLLEKSKSE